MAWEDLRENIRRLDEVLRTIGLTMPVGSPHTNQYNTSKEFLDDERAMTQTQLLAKWQNAKFEEVFRSAIGITRLSRAAYTLRAHPGLKSILKIVLTDTITQDFAPNQAKDYFYELEVATILTKAGFKVDLKEPDVVVHGNGLSRPIGIACKYPSSRKQIHGHISKGYKQLTGQNLPGFVAFGMDLIVFGEAFKEPPKYLDFNQHPEPPITVAKGHLTREIMELVPERRDKYPAELPLDGAMLSFNLWGLYRNPPEITEVTAWSLQCDEKNSIRSDMVKIKAAIENAQVDWMRP